MRTKCAYMWMELWTCAAPSVNSLHTIHCELKFVNFLHEHKGNWMHCETPGVLCSPQVHGKLIYHAPSANCLRTVSFACAYWPLSPNRTYMNSRRIPKNVSEKRQTNNVHISVFVHSHYLSLCTEYILGTSTFAESKNTGENIGKYCSENQFLQLFVNLYENAREWRRIFGIRRFSAILWELMYVQIQL